MDVFNGTLSSLMRLKDIKRKRYSSYDKSGGNDDRYHLAPKSNTLIAVMNKPGAIKHIWITMDSREILFNNKVILRMYWDDEEYPSVEVPVGDFFGAGSGKTVNFSSLPFQMNPENGKSFNCWLPMPYSKNAKITVENQCSQEVLFYYYIDYEEWADVPANLAYFHSQYRNCECEGELEILSDSEGCMTKNEEFLGKGENVTGNGNYIILDANGKGHYIGCFLNWFNLRTTREWNWYGEGDDMIFIDGEKWPPSLHGTGTEDYFGSAWCPTQQFSSPYHGLILSGGDNWSGISSMYRFHIEDPVYFEKAILATIEHGHGNKRSDFISSVAFWYQTEPHKRFPALPSWKSRILYLGRE